MLPEPGYCTSNPASILRRIQIPRPDSLVSIRRVVMVNGCRGSNGSVFRTDTPSRPECTRARLFKHHARLSWELPNPTEPLFFQEKSPNFSILLLKHVHQGEGQPYHLKPSFHMICTNIKMPSCLQAVPIFGNAGQDGNGGVRWCGSAGSPVWTNTMPGAGMGSVRRYTPQIETHRGAAVSG
jgi:hypothetical protein